MTADAQDGNLPVDLWLDERGRRCPLPIISLAKAALKSKPGTVIVVVSDDPAAGRDIPAWCRLKGATYCGDIAPIDGLGGIGYLVRLADRRTQP